MRSRGWIVIVGAAIIIVASLGALAMHNLVALVRVTEWARHAGGTGVLAYLALFVGGMILTVPSALLASIGGYVFGAVWGIPVAYAGGVLGAGATFVVGRAFAQRWIAPRAAASERFVAIDRAVEAGGLRLVVLLRLAAFLPHNFLNYALTVTRMRTRNFVFGTAIGSLPAVCVQVYAGSLASSALDVVNGRAAPRGPLAWVFTGLGLTATLAVLWFLARVARRELQRVLSTPDPPSTGAS